MKSCLEAHNGKRKAHGNGVHSKVPEALKCCWGEPEGSEEVVAATLLQPIKELEGHLAGGLSRYFLISFLIFSVCEVSGVVFR
jgi:hypothetical protein